MQLTIGGTPGSGKGTISKILAQKLLLERISIGDLFREQAQKQNMTILEFLKWCDSHPEFDKKLDEMQADLGKKKENFIFDGRTSFLFIPNATHIYLSADFTEAAKRVYADKMRKSEGDFTIEQTKKELEHRYEEEIERYQKLYGINIHDPSKYDIVIDTTKMTVDEIVTKILAIIQKSTQQE